MRVCITSLRGQGKHPSILLLLQKRDFRIVFLSFPCFSIQYSRKFLLSESEQEAEKMREEEKLCVAVKGYIDLSYIYSLFPLLILSSSSGPEFSLSFSSRPAVYSGFLFDVIRDAFPSFR